MIEKRLIKEMPQAAVCIKKQVFVQWIQMLANVGFVFLLANLIQQVFLYRINSQLIFLSALGMLAMILLRMGLSRLAAEYSYQASCEVKDSLETGIRGEITSGTMRFDACLYVRTGSSG